MTFEGLELTSNPRKRLVLMVHFFPDSITEGYHSSYQISSSLNINDKCDENETKAKTMWTCPIFAKLLLYDYISGVKGKNLVESMKFKVRDHFL